MLHNKLVKQLKMERRNESPGWPITRHDQTGMVTTKRPLEIKGFFFKRAMPFRWIILLQSGMDTLEKMYIPNNFPS